MLKKTGLLLMLIIFVLACNNDDDLVAACDAVTNVSVNDVTDNSVTISWDDANTTGSYILEYGIAGFPLGSGTTLSTTNTSTALTGLDDNATYDVYIQTICSETNVSMYTDVFTFTTSILPCEAVTNLNASMITDTSALIAWEDTVNVTGTYELEYGASGFTVGSGTSVSVTETSIEITGLNPYTDYDVYVKVICEVGNESSNSDVLSFTTLAIPVIPEFRPTLSELNLFNGDLENLEITPYGFEYDLSTKLFTDYAHKQRFIVLPTGEKLTYVNDGLPLFPDNTIIVKTFFYNNDETDLTLGRNIIETRILIKIDGSWETGNYIWNASQTEATLDSDGATVPVSWVDSEGESQSINYEIPSSVQCFICHSNNSETTPIGPKLRTLNFEVNGSNQLQALIDNEMINGLSDPTSVNTLPNSEDTSLTLDRRARAYMDINCAHCHTQGGFCEEQSTLRLSYETAFGESNILERKNSILTRIQNTIPEYGMPYIGTTILHDEGVALLLEYLDTLD
ncbi:fibronectin type III domain-containing protein [Psychroserpens algicola]|uniref:Fibronectin type III domain-containing protein n=1 Tax=Psychroserpens algicola TaxID=1719034 RepID=A0ABT0H9W8_9FLAO|nr:fibronectin type III domain-containing protein [Psychroserpens algicola]MCK8480789.1 fibronectin type III domain-containing protein [Psychroserpens algicola]